MKTYHFSKHFFYAAIFMTVLSFVIMVHELHQVEVIAKIKDPTHIKHAVDRKEYTNFIQRDFYKNDPTFEQTAVDIEDADIKRQTDFRPIILCIMIAHLLISGFLMFLLDYKHVALPKWILIIITVYGINALLSYGVYVFYNSPVTTVNVYDATFREIVDDKDPTKITNALREIFHTDITYENEQYVIQPTMRPTSRYKLYLKTGGLYNMSKTQYEFLKQLSKTYGIKFKVFEYDPN